MSHAPAPSTDADFDAVLTRARAGAPAAWDQLFRRFAPAVAGYLRLRGAAEPEDLTSEVFLAVFRNLGSFTGSEANFRSWIFVIAHRRLQDERRRRARRPAVADGGFDEAAPGGPAQLHGGRAQLHGGDVEEDALRLMATERVEAICARLAPDQRDVVLLRVVGDLTIDQIAEVLDKSPGAVKQLQRRAFEAVRRLVAREGIPL